jgi:D-alanyl-D-alanine dipeptidase
VRLALLLATACASAPPAPRELHALRLHAPSVVEDLRYAGSDNFVGAPIDGYGAATCFLTPRAAEALAAVAADLASDGLGLRGVDCYRPQRAVDHFVRWARDTADQRTKAAHYPRVPKQELFVRGYIARRSSHSRGSTVDLTLIRLPRGTPLDMGTPFDLFDERSHAASDAVPPEARANRRRLRTAMERRGFAPYAEEWWHFTLADEPFPERSFDVPIAEGDRLPLPR